MSLARSKDSWLLSPLFLGLATLTKLLPVLLLPVLFWFWNWRQRLFYGVVVVVSLLPFGLQAGWGVRGDLDGRGLFGALRIYGSQWKFNSGLFHWLEIWLGKQNFADPTTIAKVIIGLLLLLIVTAVWLLRANANKPTRCPSTDVTAADGLCAAYPHVESLVYF